MSLKKTAAMFTVALFGFGAAAQGATMTESYGYGFGFDLAPGEDTVPVPQFDDQGGTRTLQSVDLNFFGTISGSVEITNDADKTNDVGARIRGIMSVEFPKGDGDIEMLFFNDGINWGVVDEADSVELESGESHDFGLLSGTANETGSTSTDLSAFIGEGNLDLFVQGDGAFEATGTSNATVNFSNFGASGEGSVTYNYETTAIPSPATLPAGLMLVGMVAARRPRRQRQRA